MPFLYMHDESCQCGCRQATKPDPRDAMIAQLLAELATAQSEITRLTTPPDPKPGRFTPERYRARRRKMLDDGERTVDQLLDSVEHDYANHSTWVRNINETLFRQRDAITAAQKMALSLREAWHDYCGCRGDTSDCECSACGFYKRTQNGGG